MTHDINRMHPKTGRTIREDNTTLNIADQLVALEEALQAIHPLEGRGLAENRPEPNEVPVGFVYWSIDTGEIEVNNGAAWALIGEV